MHICRFIRSFCSKKVKLSLTSNYSWEMKLKTFTPIYKFKSEFYVLEVPIGMNLYPYN